MEISSYSYDGFYARFETPSKKIGSMLTGPDNIVGDDYTVFFKTEDGNVVAWLKNKFDAEVGYFEPDVSRKLQLANARNQTIRCLLSFVAYSDKPEPGMYWGQVAVFCFDPVYADEFNAFVDRCSSKIAEGIRPNIDLGTQAVRRIFDEPDWLPSDTIPLPKKEVGSAILKDHQSVSEKMIEQGRSKNIGCYIVSWAFIILVVAGVVYGLHVIGLF